MNAAKTGHQGIVRRRTPGFESPTCHVLSGESALAFSGAHTPFGGLGVCLAAPFGPSRRVVRHGEPVCVDFAMAREGYVHDVTRTLCLGGLRHPTLLRAFELCGAMLDMVRSKGRPGVTGEALWRECVSMAQAAGLGSHFMGLGHGVGLELDELPVLGEKQSMALAEGHVLAVEPKFFFPGCGAVGLEDTFAVTADGLETFTTCPRVPGGANGW